MTSAPDARSRVLRAAVAAVLAAGVAVRLHSESVLWLDEALSVSIARLPLGELPAALRQDGSPPLYYLLLHAWMSVVGTGTTAVRALSTVLAVGAIPLAFLAGRRLRSETAGWVAALLVASLPFLVRYATEARMYALVVVLVLCGVLAVHAALAAPTPLRLVAVAAVSGLLLLTHYWSLYLLAVTAAVLARPAWRVASAVVAGGLLFLPWLPSFLFQVRHTGTPWALPPELTAARHTAAAWTGGETPAAVALGVLLLVLLVLTLRREARPAGVLLSVGLGTLLLGLVVTRLAGIGYAPRYSSVAVVPVLLAAAVGAAAVPARLRTPLVGAAVACGLVGSAQLPFADRRTQAAEIADALRAELRPDDLVVYCPDQYGPAVSRLLPAGVQQAVYPTLAGPERVDWVDYAERHAAASPQAVARTVLDRTDGAIWLVWRGGHRTLGTQCEELDRALADSRGGRRLVLEQGRSYGERADLTRYPERRAPAVREGAPRG